jgi:hypothetical protein
MNRLRTAENVEEANTTQDFDENEDENDTDDETQPSTSGNRTQDPVPGVVVLTLILIVYAGLMMITGVMVYSAYGNGKIAIEGFTPSNSAINVAVITGICPVDNICPIDCIKNPDACIPQSKPPCTPQVWPSRTDCWDSTATNCPNGGCAPPECPMTTTTEPSIQAFRSAFYENQRVVDLINLYPPHSPNRLEVVTTLLYKTVEQFAMLGHFHRCGSSLNDRPLHTTICSFCNDRYEYIRCAMSNNLVGQLYPDEPPSANHLVPIFWETELSKMHDDLVTNVYKTCWPRSMDYIFDRIEKMIRPFALKTAAGDECRVCKDFSRAIFDRCYTKDTRYT